MRWIHRVDSPFSLTARVSMRYSSSTAGTELLYYNQIKTGASQNLGAPLPQTRYSVPSMHHLFCMIFFV